MGNVIQCTSGNRGTSGPHLGAGFPSAICVWSYGVDLSASAPVFGSVWERASEIQDKVGD